MGVRLSSALPNPMNRRGFLKSIASVAGAKALAPLAPLVPVQACVDVEEVKRLIPLYRVRLMKYRQLGITTVTFPKHGTYPVEVT